jgi:hypothetical protein
MFLFKVAFSLPSIATLEFTQDGENLDAATEWFLLKIIRGNYFKVLNYMKFGLTEI